MMAGNEDTYEEQPTNLNIPALSLLLGLVALCFTVNDLLAAKTFTGPPGWTPLTLIAVNLLIVGTTWGLFWLKPSRLKTAALSVLLGFVALMGLGAAAGIMKVLVATNTLWGPWAWQTVFMFVSNLFIGVCCISILLWFKPWKGWKGSDEPVSPRTRRTNKLYWLTELVAAVGMLTLIYGSNGTDKPSGLFSNGPLSPGIALFVSATWVLAMMIGWWRYFSADEHERKVNDFGKLIGFRLFFTLTPVWWIAARAGLLPPPDAMVLWFVVAVVSAIGYVWRRNH